MPHAAKQDRTFRTIRQPLLRALVPLGLVFLLLTTLITRTLYDSELNLIRQGELTMLEQSRLRLQKSLQPIWQHISSLRREPPVLQGVRAPDQGLDAMAQNFASLLSRTPHYFQVRWLDHSGQERLRLERTANGYRRVADARLQDKSDRYYVQDTLALDAPNEIYVSPIDLNREQGKIEHPIRPTMRVATPLYEGDVSHGLLVINVDVSQWLDELQATLRDQTGRLQLISPEGSWIEHPDPALEWGTLLRHNTTFRQQQPEIWQQMHNFRHNQLMTETGLWSWVSLYPRDQHEERDQSALGFLLLHIPDHRLQQLKVTYWGSAALCFLTLLGATFLILYRLLLQRYTREQAEQQAREHQQQALQLRKQRENEQRFRTIFNASHTPLLVCNSQGKITLVNPALEKLFGYSVFELTGLPVEYLIPESLRHAHAEQRHRYLSHLKPRSKMMNNGQSLQGLCKDGRTLDVEIGLSPYETDGEVFILATLEDISGRIASEQRIKALHQRKTQHLQQARDNAERLARLKSDFLANMSHEIRTPLNAILLLSELLEQEQLNDKAHKLTCDIRQAGSSLLHIINDVLDFSRIEADGLQLEQTTFSLQDMLQQLQAVCAPQANRKGLRLQLDSGAPRPLTLLGDPYRLKQVLLNLISNAIKFTSEGAVTLSTEAEEIRLESHIAYRLHFRVTDTGPGIAPEHQVAIFNAFTQEDSSVSRQFGGTGLGLTISRQLIRLMGSELNLQSTPGQGSCFSFVITLPESRLPTQEHNVASPTAPELNDLCILLADDSDLNRGIIRHILETAGAVVIAAENGQDALQQLNTAPEAVDLILTDLQMPGLDGYRTIREIRQRPEYQSTPIIAMTAGISDRTHQDAIEAGADQVLSKPLTLHDIYQSLQHLLHNKKTAANGHHVSELISGNKTLQAPAPAPSSEDELPLLDEARGLSNWGDRASLQHFLQRFVREYGHCDTTIRDLLIQSRTGQARALAHKIKGAAGSLYLSALQDALQQLEYSLESGQDPESPLIRSQTDLLSATLSRTLQAISQHKAG